MNCTREYLWCHRFCSHRQPDAPLLSSSWSRSVSCSHRPSKEHVLRPVNRGSQFTQLGMQFFDAPRFSIQVQVSFSLQLSWVGTRRCVRLIDELIRDSCSRIQVLDARSKTQKQGEDRQRRLPEVRTTGPLGQETAPNPAKGPSTDLTGRDAGNGWWQWRWPRVGGTCGAEPS